MNVECVWWQGVCMNVECQCVCVCVNKEKQGRSFLVSGVEPLETLADSGIGAFQARNSVRGRWWKWPLLQRERSRLRGLFWERQLRSGSGKRLTVGNSSYSYSLKICELTAALLILMLVGGVEHRALDMLGKCSAWVSSPAPGNHVWAMGLLIIR